MREYVILQLNFMSYTILLNICSSNSFLVMKFIFQYDVLKVYNLFFKINHILIMALNGSYLLNHIDEL